MAVSAVYFPALQLVSLVNHPILVADSQNKICIADFGWWIFASLSTCRQKKHVCRELTTSGIMVKPHHSENVFARENALLDQPFQDCIEIAIQYVTNSVVSDIFNDKLNDYALTDSVILCPRNDESLKINE